MTAIVEVLYARLLQFEQANFDTAKIERECCEAILRESPTGTIVAFGNRITLTVERVAIGNAPPFAYVRGVGRFSAIRFDFMRERRRFPRDTVTIMAASGDEATRLAGKIAKRLREV